MMLVRESLSNFERGKDPKAALGLGKKAQIKKWFDDLGIDESLYEIRDDLTIDTYERISFSRKELREFPYFIEFNRAYGSFLMQNNYFTSLRGCPKRVDKIFTCSQNLLSNLEFAPKFVGETFICYNNEKVFSVDYIRKMSQLNPNMPIQNIPW